MLATAVHPAGTVAVLATAELDACACAQTMMVTSPVVVPVGRLIDALDVLALVGVDAARKAMAIIVPYAGSGLLPAASHGS